MNRKKREVQILDAAVRMFSRQGYPNTSVSEIIEEARVARGTFYLYFKSKKDLFHTLIDRFMKDIARDVAKIYTQAGNGLTNLHAEFRQMAGDLVTTITKNRLLTKLILADSNGLEGDFDAKLTVFYDQLAGIIRHNLDRNIEAGVLRACHSEVVSRCMIGSVKELISHWVVNDTIELEPTLEGLIDYLLNGVAPMPVTTAEKHEAQEQARHPRPNANFH